MQIQFLNNPIPFQSRCPEIKLGQDVCHIINSKFPYYSMTKYRPIISKRKNNIKNPQKFFMSQYKLFAERPMPCNSLTEYFSNLFDFYNKYNSFNCFESSQLSALVLKSYGVKNCYTASIKNGDAKIDHVVCFFNRDGSEFTGKIKNNQTIIVDAWAGICDFANNVFKEYGGYWQKYLNIAEHESKYANGKYEFRNIKSFDLNQQELNINSTIIHKLMIS